MKEFLPEEKYIKLTVPYIEWELLNDLVANVIDFYEEVDNGSSFIIKMHNKYLNVKESIKDYKQYIRKKGTEMSKTLMSLEESNERFQQQASIINAPQKNGIACPECGEELYDSNPMVVLTSYPTQKEIHCANCEYKGYRYC